MKISTRGRYAVRVMLDLAQQDTSEYTPLMDIARRQEISEKYLESIVSMLVKNDFLAALRGKGGGYKLIRRPGRIYRRKYFKNYGRLFCTGCLS